MARRTTRKNGPGGGITRKTKSSRSGLSGNGGIKAKTARGTETNPGDKDGRMAAARQKSLNKDVKKAGGADAYLKKQKSTKANLVKVGSVYRRKKN